MLTAEEEGFVRIFDRGISVYAPSKKEFVYKERGSEMMKKLVLLLAVVLLSGLSANGALIYEDFSAYTGYASAKDWIAPDVTDDPGWNYPNGMGSAEGVDLAVTLPDGAVGVTDIGTDTAYKVVFGPSSGEKDTNIQLVLADVYEPGNDYIVTVKWAVGQGAIQDINLMLMGRLDDFDGSHPWGAQFDPGNRYPEGPEWVEYSAIATAQDILDQQSLGYQIRVTMNIDGDRTGTEGGDILYITDLEIVPEPATMVLLGLGGLALIRRRK